MTSTFTDIEVLVRGFVDQVVAAVENDVRQRILDVVASATGGASTVARGGGAIGRASGASSPKIVAARKLQGQYLGMLRGLSETNRLRVRKVAREQGVQAALKLGRTLK